jgi:hypothetical protein
MKRFLIHVTTEWCGMDQDYAAIAKTAEELEFIAEELAYENFTDFNCLAQIMEDENISEDEAINIESQYYGYYIDEWDESRPSEEWNWFELVYDSTNVE